MIATKYLEMQKGIRKIYPKYKERISEKEKKARKEEYHKRNNQIYEDFKKELLKAYGVENHPKVEKVWNLAWEYGHSNGFSEVETHFCEFVELIKGDEQ